MKPKRIKKEKDAKCYKTWISMRTFEKKYQII